MNIIENPQPSILAKATTSILGKVMYAGLRYLRRCCDDLSRTHPRPEATYEEAYTADYGANLGMSLILTLRK